jgi:hypothetical protein
MLERDEQRRFSPAPRLGVDYLIAEAGRGSAAGAGRANIHETTHEAMQAIGVVTCPTEPGRPRDAVELYGPHGERPQR